MAAVDEGRRNLDLLTGTVSAAAHFTSNDAAVDTVVLDDYVWFARDLTIANGINLTINDGGELAIR